MMCNDSLHTLSQLVMLSHIATRRASRLYVLLILLLHLFSLKIIHHVDCFGVLKSNFMVLTEIQRSKLHTSSSLFVSNSKTSKEDQSNKESSLLWSDIMNSIPSKIYSNVKNKFFLKLKNKKCQDSKMISYANDPQHIVFVNINELYPITSSASSIISSYNQTNIICPVTEDSSCNQISICPVTEERRIFTHDLITRLKLGQLNRAEKESYYYSALNFGNSVESRKPVVISDKSYLNNYSSQRINIETTNLDASASYKNLTKINSPGKLINSKIEASEDMKIMQSADESTRNNQSSTIAKFKEETGLVEAYIYDSESNTANNVETSGNDLYASSLYESNLSTEWNELQPENKIETRTSVANEKRANKRVTGVKNIFEQYPSHHIRPKTVVLETNLTKLPHILPHNKEVVKKKIMNKPCEYDDMKKTVILRFDPKPVQQIQPIRFVHQVNMTKHSSNLQSDIDIFACTDIELASRLDQKTFTEEAVISNVDQEPAHEIRFVFQSNTTNQQQFQQLDKLIIGERESKHVEAMEKIVVPSFEQKQKQHLQHLHTVNKENLTVATKLSQEKIQQLKDTVGKHKCSSTPTKLSQEKIQQLKDTVKRRNMELAKRLEHAAYLEQKAKCQAKSNQKEVDEISSLTSKSKLMDKILESHFQKYNHTLSSEMIRKRGIDGNYVIDDKQQYP